jgi:hypothetical protein
MLSVTASVRPITKDYTVKRASVHTQRLCLVLERVRLT